MARLLKLVGILLIVVSSFFPIFLLGTFADSEGVLLAGFCHEDEVPVISNSKRDMSFEFSSNIPAGSYHCKHSESGLRDISNDIQDSLFGQLIHLSSQVGVSTVSSVLGSLIGVVFLVAGIVLGVIARANPDVVYKRASVEGQGRARSVEVKQLQGRTSGQSHSQGSIKVPGIFGSVSKLFGLNISEESIKQLQELQKLQLEGELTDEEAKKRVKEILFTRK